MFKKTKKHSFQCIEIIKNIFTCVPFTCALYDIVGPTIKRSFIVLLN